MEILRVCGFVLSLRSKDVASVPGARNRFAGVGEPTTHAGPAPMSSLRLRIAPFLTGNIQME